MAKDLLGMQVRGADYLRDKKKIPAAEPVFSLAATDLLQVDKPTPHIARYLPSLRYPSPARNPDPVMIFNSPGSSAKDNLVRRKTMCSTGRSVKGKLSGLDQF
jgi:hypothetical protein